VTLPEGSEVWSARIDGRTQQPARETGSDADAPVVLLNIVSAAEAFPVELVYATSVARLGAFGRLGAELPKVDVVVTRSRWEIFLPDGASYMDPDTSMTFAGAGRASTGEWAADRAPGGLALEVPAEGHRYVFTQMYAGRSGETVSVAIPYADGWGHTFAIALSALGAILFWLGLIAFGVLRLGIPVPAAVGDRLPIALSTYRANESAAMPTRILHRTTATILGIAAGGALILAIAHGYLGTSTWPALTVTVLCAAGALGMTVKHHLDARRARAAAAISGPAPERAS
jgi:hypothetical protein